MSNYPAKMAVLASNFVVTDGDPNSTNPTSYVFLDAFSILKVERQGRGFHFDEIRQVDETGLASIAVLEALTSRARQALGVR